jgi:chorismate mutase
VDADDPRQLTAAVRELLDALVATNAIARHDIVSAIFTTTSDLRSLHPAAVARAMGWHDVPMLCVAEMEVEGALPRCVRVMLHVAVRDERALRAAYLREARALRPDLVPAD